jgi:hypothetical protein
MKRKINVNRPEISPQEIAKRRDFESVLKQANVGGSSGGGKPFFKKPWFLSGAVVATIAVVTAVFVMNHQGEKKNDAPELSQNEQPAANSQELEAFYKAEEAKPCINPPIPGLNVEYTVYKVIAEKGATLNFKTGSTITIPKNAFTDANGKMIKGEVELRYREFHDAADFFVAGIPMTYDSAGVRYQFESAGMMEMLAYQDGKQVGMTPGKSVNVELASDYSGTEYNLYKLDTNINNWYCLGKDKVIKNIRAIASTDSMKRVPVTELPEYKAIEVKKAEAARSKETQLAALPKPDPEPRKPQQVKKGKYTFNIDVDPKEFPELSVYKGLLFEVGDENTTFSKAMYDITWDEAAVKEGSKSGENYNLTLKKGAKKYDLVVYPVFEGKDFETAQKEYQEKFKKYETVLDKRIANEKRIEAEYQAQVAKYKAEQDAIIRKLNEREANLFKEADTEQKVKRMFAVNSFGVFNCDNPSAYPKGTLCTASLKAEKDRDLKCYDVFLVDKQKNGLFTYSKNPIATFSFNPDSRNMLWTVENGVLYWLKPEQFSSIKSGEGMSKLQMNRVDRKFESVDDLKTYFSF